MQMICIIRARRGPGHGSVIELRIDDSETRVTIKLGRAEFAAPGQDLRTIAMGESLTVKKGDRGVRMHGRAPTHWDLSIAVGQEVVILRISA